MGTSTVVYQYLAVLSMNLLNISYGMAVSWSSSSVLILKSLATPLNNGIPMTETQISWITSLLGLGGLTGSILTGCLADFFGRKKALLCLAVPQVASWILIIMASDAIFLCLSRFLAGLTAGGIFVIIPVYTAEIAEDRIRGKLGSYLSLSINLGILLGFIAGNYLTFFTIPKYALSFSIIHFVTFIFFPESPIYLLRKGKLNGAVKALQFYRNSRRMSEENLDFFKNELEKLMKTRENNGKPDTGITWKDFQYKSTRKAFLIGFMIVLLHAFCGVFVMTNYAASIFTDSGSHRSPNVAAIFVGLLLFIGNYLSTFLVDRIGRKPLFITSSLGTGLSLTIFGVFSYITYLGYDTTKYGWIPIVTFSAMMFIAAGGILPLLSVIISEIMPDKLRTVGAMSCVCLSWCLAFISVFYFPSLQLAVGLHGCIFFFAGSCFVGAACVYLYMPETKGKTFYEIIEALET